MKTERFDYEYGVEIVVWNESNDPAARFAGYTILCKDFDFDKTNDFARIAPTAVIHAPKPRDLTFEEARRRAREFDYVADLAEQLQAEKRAKYAAQFGD